MVKPLLKEARIGGIILENPFYGLRKPTDQVLVSDTVLHDALSETKIIIKIHIFVLTPFLTPQNGSLKLKECFIK